MSAKPGDKDSTESLQSDTNLESSINKGKLESERKRRADELFEELQERADAVDRVMTKNGPPEEDLTSG